MNLKTIYLITLLFITSCVSTNNNNNSTLNIQLTYTIKKSKECIEYFEKSDLHTYHYYYPLIKQINNAEKTFLTDSNKNSKQQLNLFIRNVLKIDKESSIRGYMNAIDTNYLNKISENKFLTDAVKNKNLYIISINSIINYYTFNIYNFNHSESVPVSFPSDNNDIIHIANLGLDTSYINTFFIQGESKYHFKKHKISLDTLNLDKLFIGDYSSKTPYTLSRDTQKTDSISGLIFLKDMRESFYKKKEIYFISTFKF